MFRTPIFSIVLLLTSSLSYCQHIQLRVHYQNKPNRPASDTIYYDVNRKLTWGDFKGKVDSNHFGGAVTASGFAYNAQMEYDEDRVIIDIFVYTYFNKRDSWKKPGINSAYHLEHEQKHFDITYLGALKFMAELQKAKFTAKNFKTLPNKIFDKVYDENTALQHQYDLETKHSINKEAQEVWNKKISAWMEEAFMPKGVR